MVFTYGNLWIETSSSSFIGIGLTFNQRRAIITIALENTKLTSSAKKLLFNLHVLKSFFENKFY